MLVKNKYYILGIVFGLVLIGIGIYFFLKKGNSCKVSPCRLQGDTLMKRESFPTAVPTSALPTPTPTLTPEQIAEIRRKKFDELNAKYGPCKYVPILMYHHIMDAKAAKDIGSQNLNVPPDIFRQQMDYLIGKGYNVIGLNEMISGLRNNSLPAKPIVLTFDDGYRDFFDSAYAILKEKNFKATVFVITQFVGGERYLEWWQIREMANSGLILIGDHTLNHRSIPSLSKEEEKDQIVSAKNILEQYVGKQVNLFAYPYGSANQNAKEILKENGFLGAVITTGPDPACIGLPYELPRIRIGAASLSRFGLY